MDYKFIVMQIEEIDREIDKLSRKKKQLEDILVGEGPLLPRDGKTLWQKAEDVLERDGKPMHTKEILRRIEEEFKTRVAFKSLSQVLYSKAKGRKIFFKDKQQENTYGLLKWNEATKAAGLRSE
jgi:hypothetical protein